MCIYIYIHICICILTYFFFFFYSAGNNRYEGVADTVKGRASVQRDVSKWEVLDYLDVHRVQQVEVPGVPGAHG